MEAVLDAFTLPASQTDCLVHSIILCLSVCPAYIATG